ncbi:MAG: stage II sporulation protein D, partial [Oscillospiraceae bacterium]|nr:stage II sporulation protein D [Oscillospiraceae bacterium]
ALKAQAIAARTYTLYKMRQGPIENHPDADACDDISCCKAYKTREDAAADWGSMALYYEEKLARAVHETDGKVVLYGGEPILAVFFSSSAGHTQNAGTVWQTDLPYLQSVDSPESEELVPNYYSVERFSAEEFRKRFLAAYPGAELSGAPTGWIGSIERSEAGFVTSVSVGGTSVRGNELRTILGLRSPAFTVEAQEDSLTFRVTGYGHGVGMSQYGANVLASHGMTAEEILEHYFTGVTVGTL